MNIEEIKNVPKWAGIYYFKNNINNKYYIGQSIMLKKRIQHHISNYKNERYDTPLYRAFNKYGLEAFEFGILEEFKSGYTIKDLKNKLDELEIFYIEKYNSYGSTGYNQTKGGDAGVLGYKMTSEQKDKISESAQKQIYNTEHPIETWVKAKNLETGYEVIVVSEEELSRFLCGNAHKLRSSIHRCLTKTQHTCNNYIIAYYLEEYPDIKLSEQSIALKGIPPKVKRKITIDGISYKDIEGYLPEEIEDAKTMTIFQWKTKYNNRNTYYNIRHSLGIKSVKRIDIFDWAKIKELKNSGKTAAQVFKELNIKPTGSSYKRFKSL